MGANERADRLVTLRRDEHHHDSSDLPDTSTDPQTVKHGSATEAPKPAGLAILEAVQHGRSRIRQLILSHEHDQHTELDRQVQRCPAEGPEPQETCKWRITRLFSQNFV